MDDNSTFSAFGIDLGGFFGDIGNKYAQSKGYGSIYDLGVNEAAKNVGRLVDKPGEDVKQTPAVIQPGAWSEQLNSVLPVKFSLTNTQIALGALVGLGVIYLLIKR